MKKTFTVQQSTLNKALQTCSKALSENKNQPQCANFLLQVNKSKLKITACDMMLIISTDIAIESTGKFEICIPGNDLLSYISKSNNEPLVFEIETHIVPASVETIIHPISLKPQDIHTAEQVSYSAWVKSSTNTANKAKFNAESGDNFPQIQNIDPVPFQIPAEDLLELFYKTLYCCSEDDLWPKLTGLLVVIHGKKITATATNTHILATFNADINTPESATVIIPRQTLQKIQALNMAGDIDVCISKDVIDFNWSGVKSSARLIDGKYPDYMAVLPTGNDIDFLTSRTGLINAISRIITFSDMQKQLILNISAESIELLAQNIDYNKQASETVTGVLNGDPITIAVNGNFLLSVLKTMTDDNVWLSLNAPNRPILITAEKHINPGKENLCLIMPQAIGGVK